MKYIQYIFNLSLMLSVLLTAPANASIIYSGILNQEGPNFSIDLNKDGEIDFLTNWTTWAVGNGTSISGFNTIVNFNIRYIKVPSGQPPVLNVNAPLNYGEIIKLVTRPYNFMSDPMIWHKWNMFNEPHNTYNGPWHNVSGKYLGFELTVGSQLFCGWIQIKTDTTGNIVVVDFAYENNPFTPIKAGFKYTLFNPGILLLLMK